MQFPRGFLVPFVALLAFGVNPGRAAASPLPLQPQAYGQEGGWEAPPRELNETQRRGFHDGVEGARRDFDNHRRPDVENREEFRDPHVDREFREAYRDGFRRGYEEAAAHLWGAPTQPPPPPPPPPVQQQERHDWDDWGMRGLASDAERQGYREGAEAAQNDVQFQRRPDPDDHDAFRSPRVPPQVVDAYREAFIRGYEVTISHLNGEPAWQDRGDPDSWVAPEHYSEIQRRGFHDGIVGAKRDRDNHRRPSVLNRDEYRQPHLPEELWGDYREGFRRGYEMTAAQIWGGR
jgi:hypothetical protein